MSPSWSTAFKVIFVVTSENALPTSLVATGGMFWEKTKKEVKKKVRKKKFIIYFTISKIKILKTYELTW